MVNKYPRQGIKEIEVSGTSGSATGTHTTDYKIDGLVTNISIRARHKTTHTINTANGGAIINITIHTQT